MYPDVAQLEAFPYQSNPALFDLAYAEQVSAQIPDEDVAYDLHLPWHDIIGWVFDLCMAQYALATCTDLLDPDAASDVIKTLDRMQFRMSPLFRDEDDLEETARDAFDVLCEIHAEREVI